MKRLGIAIKNTIQGSGEPIKINAGDWVKKVTDIRNVLRHMPLMKSEPTYTATFFSFSEKGCYITVARSLPNRPDDNVAGWIFVPYDIEISGEALCRVIGRVRSIITQSELPPESHLESLFATEYPVKGGAVPFHPSPRNDTFAKRTVSQPGMLPVLFGDARYQPYYSGFEAVILEEETGEVVDATDLTERPLEKMKVLHQPPRAKNPKVKAEDKEAPYWWVELNDGSEGRIIVRGANVRRYESPLRGYESEGDKLVYQENNPWPQRALGFAAALLLCGIVLTILALCGVFRSKTPEDKMEKEEPDELVEYIDSVNNRCDQNL